MRAKVNRPEILSPAGDPEKLRYAVDFGADAVYCALKSFGMRAMADNFTPQELKQGIEYAHARNCKVYLTLNVMPHEAEYSEIDSVLDEISSCLPDAFIVSDPGVINVLKKRFPDTELHLSTQCSVVNSGTCRFWYDLGIRRIVLARELTLEEIRKIRANIPDDLSLEVFVHGAMCVAYSGRCILSKYLTSRGANVGACAQPCRYAYYVTEATRPGLDMPIEEENGETYLFSSRDLCMIEHLAELADAGISSLKIEGRMKSAYYTAVVTSAYKLALDDAICGRVFDKALMDMLCGVSHREYDTGFFYSEPSQNANICDTNGYIRDRAFLATVDESVDGKLLCTQRNKMYAGDTVRLISPGEKPRNAAVRALFDADMNPIDSTPHPKMRFFAEIDGAQRGDIVLSV